MKIKLLVVGKTNAEFKNLISEYTYRLKKYTPFEIDTIPDLKKSKKLSIEEIKTKEEKLILSKLTSERYVILLDERGKSFSSNGFALHLQKTMNKGMKTIVFVVGGAYGASKRIHALALKRKISMSEMTLSHQMIRLLFVEQLYRGFTILNNEPYHHQ